ncbi:MAG: hypothetical protein IH998_02400, partial [Proteobacteria bacterium]|nr:hypothetical protein [Pseudomonadota bacterium]
MERLDGGSAVPSRYRGAIVALGNFDGFHLGHQAVVGRAVARARAEGRPALVGTFDPHPQRYFRPDSPWFRLTTMDQRQRLLVEAGIDAMLVFPFNAALAALSARGFAEERLVGFIGAGGVVTGGDFTFGKGREGDVATLAALGAELGFSAETVAPVRLDGEIVSSSRIREHLREGRPAEAARLLTRPFAIEGVVQHVFTHIRHERGQLRAAQHGKLRVFERVSRKLKQFAEGGARAIVNYGAILARLQQHIDMRRHHR